MAVSHRLVPNKTFHYTVFRSQITGHRKMKESCRNTIFDSLIDPLVQMGSKKPVICLKSHQRTSLQPKKDQVFSKLQLIYTEFTTSLDLWVQQLPMKRHFQAKTLFISSKLEKHRRSEMSDSLRNKATKQRTDIS